MPKVPDSLKKDVVEKVEKILEETLRPNHIIVQPHNAKYNYLAELGCKWYRHYFYIFGIYNPPASRPDGSTFEAKFSRMEYVGNQRFNLAYMRHTEQWWELYQAQTLEESLEIISTQIHFLPPT